MSSKNLGMGELVHRRQDGATNGLVERLDNERDRTASI